MVVFVFGEWWVVVAWVVFGYGKGKSVVRVSNWVTVVFGMG